MNNKNNNNNNNDNYESFQLTDIQKEMINLLL